VPTEVTFWKANALPYHSLLLVISRKSGTMATAVAPKPSAPHQTKMKRPPLPTVQTNGVHSSQSSRSPSVSSKRPPGFKQPPTPTVNGINGDANGLGPRLSNRRKDSQKPGDIQGRPSRTGRGGADGERRPAKRMTEPYVKTQDYVLKRHRNKPPSLIIHLHPTHFRFDTQDGSFSYNSPMKFILEHLKAQTIPHDMMEDLTAAGTRFYEGCLIVQIQDHRTNSGESSISANSTEDDSYVPFSIHNYNEHITPSPYVPYPKKAEVTANGDASDANSRAVESSGSKDKEPSKGPNKFTLVLFPTPLSVHEEVIIQANTVDPRQNNRKQSTAVPRTPASATIPPTPSTAVPPTPSTSGPPAKKQKMMISGNEIHGFESKLIHSTAPPLFLDHVDNLEDAHRVLESLTDSQHKEPYPAPKIKKRTIAELAADEAIAAQEQDFMLIMNERYSAGAAGAKAGGTDGEAGIPTFQPNFEQWQAIRNIKAEQKERAARELEAKAIHEATQQANRLRKEQQEKAAKKDMERRAEQLARDQQQINNMNRQNQINREMHARELQRQALAGQNQIAHGNAHPLPNGNSHAQNSSPIPRNNTPNSHSSPMAGNLPMNITSSGQGVTSSPARPPSAIQHAQPGGIGMARQISRQQAPSRTGTPQMNGTPAMPHATPVMGQHATPRMPQGSPPIGTNPTLNHNIHGHLNGQPPHFSPEQQHQVLEQLKRDQIYARNHQAHQQQLQRDRMQNSSPNSQMSPEQRNPAQMQSLQQQAALNQQRYQQSLRMHHASMNGPPGHPNMPNGASPPQQNPQQAHLQQRPNPPMQITPQQKQHLQAQSHHLYQGLLNNIARKYGGNLAAIPQPERLQCEQQARHMAQEQMKKHLIMAHQKAKETQQAQFQQMAAMNGMNGMNMQGMSDQQRQAMMQQMQGMQQMSQMPHMGGNGVQNVNGMVHNKHMNGGGMGGMQ